MTENADKLQRIVVGRDGYIGRSLIELFKEQNIPYVATSRKPAIESDRYLEITESKSYFFNEVPQGSLVYVLASVSSPDFCKQKPEAARKVNVEGTKQLITSCLENGLRVCFASSDTVFGKSKGVCLDDSPVNPCGAYGQMKAEIEDCFGNVSDFKSVRFSYVYSLKDKFSRYLIDCVLSHKEAELYDPFLRSAVALSDVVKGLSRLDECWNDIPSAVNFCGRNLVSRREIADAYNRYWNDRLSYKVVTPDESFFEDRPRCIHTQSKYFSKILGVEVQDLDDAIWKELKNYLSFFSN